MEDRFREDGKKKRKFYVKFRKTTKRWRRGMPMFLTAFGAAVITFLIAGYAKKNGLEGVGMYIWISVALCVVGLIIKAISSAEAYATIKSRENEELLITDDSIVYSYSTKFNPESYGHSSTVIKDVDLANIKKITCDAEHGVVVISGNMVYTTTDSLSSYLNSKRNAEGKKSRNKKEKNEICIYNYYENAVRLAAIIKSLCTKGDE